MEKFIEQFDNYTENFDFSNKTFISKYHHSYRVMENASSIANLLFLSDKDIYLSSIIGLLHDIGIFENMKNNTDIDHADAGINYLFDKANILEFEDDTRLYETIKKAIQFHNKYVLPRRGLNKEERLHAKILKDADRIDILYYVGVLKEIKLNCDDTPISSMCDRYFKGHELVPYDMIKSDNDKVLSYLSYVFDLNFDESKTILIKKCILPIFFKNIGENEVLKPYFDMAIKYIET